MPESEPDREVVITFRDEYIHISHPDNFVILPEAIEGLWQNLAEACKAFGCNRVLNEGSVDLSRLRDFDTYNAGTQAGLIRGLRMACLFPNYVPDEQSEFFKMVASNRGAKVEFFNDRAEALEWLGVMNAK